MDTGDVRRSIIVGSVADAISNGVVRRLDASSEDLSLVSQCLEDLVLEGIHKGEHEGLALMLTLEGDEYCWCCSDKFAYKAAGMLGLSERCVCLDESLRRIGHECSLPHEYCREFMDLHVGEGVENRITGDGIRA